MEAPNPLKAVIFANGDAGDGPAVRATLEQSQGAWCIAADGGARQAAFFGFQPKTVIGDMDSLSSDEIDAQAAAGAEIRRFPIEKDETDLELALKLAADNGARWIRIIGAIGDRLDQTLGNIYLLALPDLRGLDVRITAGKQQAWLLYPGETLIEGQPDDTLSLIPVNGAAKNVRTTGLYYPLRGETLAFGPARGISNVLTTSPAKVAFSSGILLAIHTIGRA